MKRLLIVSLSLFIVSIIFRFLHWPGSSLLAILSVFLLFVFSIINSFSKKVAFKLNILEGWLLFSWAAYILFKYLFWANGPSIIGFSSMFLVVFSLTAIYIIITTKKKKELSTAVIVICCVGFTFSFVPSHSICYLFDLNETLNEEQNKTNYYSWDKYSWFLYIRGEKDRALTANQKAVDAWHKSTSLYYDYPEDTTYLSALNKHRQEIINGSWTEGFVRHPSISPR